MPELLTPEDFLSHVDKVFRVKGGRHALTLTKVEQRRLEPWEAEMTRREPFNLLFRGLPGDVLPQGLYTFEVEDGPSFELYLIPIHTPTRDRQNYQAPFN
jgi:hypothetical protein